MNILFSKEENKEIYVSCCVICTLGFSLERGEYLIISNLIKTNRWNLLFHKIGWSKLIKKAADLNGDKGPAFNALICLEKYFPNEMYKMMPHYKEDYLNKLKKYCLDFDDPFRFIERIASRLIEAHSASNWGSCSIKVFCGDLSRFDLNEIINLLSKILFNIGILKSAVIGYTNGGIASIKITKCFA